MAICDLKVSVTKAWRKIVWRRAGPRDVARRNRVQEKDYGGKPAGRLHLELYFWLTNDAGTKLQTQQSKKRE